MHNGPPRGLNNPKGQSKESGTNKLPKNLYLDQSDHSSKETGKHFAIVPNRFDLVFNPTHGSWLNIFEGLFA